MNLIFEYSGYVFLVVAGLIPIANPFSTAPLFIGMTAELTTAQRNKVAKLSTLYMFAVLTVFLLLGAAILNFFGISLQALRIAGGLIIGVIGFRMLFEDDSKSKEINLTEKDANQIAFTPLAMPMLSGPGSIAVVISMAVSVSEVETLTGKVLGYFVVTLGIALSAFICWLVLRASGRVVGFMGKSGIDVLTKIMGFMLTSIGVQFIISGMQSLITN